MELAATLRTICNVAGNRVTGVRRSRSCPARAAAVDGRPSRSWWGRTSLMVSQKRPKNRWASSTAPWHLAHAADRHRPSRRCAWRTRTVSDPRPRSRAGFPCARTATGGSPHPVARRRTGEPNLVLAPPTTADREASVRFVRNLEAQERDGSFDALTQQANRG